MWQPDICIYHGNCADGFGAAWAVWKRFGDAVEYVPGVYGKAPPHFSGKHVVMVDFSYKRPVLEEMQKGAASLTILDHHKTAAEDLKGIERHPLESAVCIGIDCATDVIFDMERSGAQIAWDYFHPGTARPVLLDYVGDRDLWRFRLIGSREINAVVFSHPYDFDQWSLLAEECEISDIRNRMICEGAAIERKHKKDIAELLDATMRYMVIGGHRVPVANLPYTMASDAAGQLAEGNPFAACYFDRADARVFSLRSRGDGLDVSEVAKAYGGGGHRHAAGFQVPIGWEGDRPSA